jgi:hypothetical protein
MFATVVIQAPRNSRAGGGTEIFSSAANRNAGSSNRDAIMELVRFMRWQMRRGPGPFGNGFLHWPAN